MTRWKVNHYENNDRTELIVQINSESLDIDSTLKALFTFNDVKRIHIGKARESSSDSEERCPRIFSVATTSSRIILETVDAVETGPFLHVLLAAMDSMGRSPRNGFQSTKNELKSLRDDMSLDIYFDSDSTSNSTSNSHALSPGLPPTLSSRANSGGDIEKGFDFQQVQAAGDTEKGWSPSNSGSAGLPQVLMAGKRAAKKIVGLSQQQKKPEYHLQQTVSVNTATTHFNFDDETKSSWSLAQINQFGFKKYQFRLKQIGKRSWELKNDKRTSLKVEEIDRIFVGKATDILLKSKRCRKVPHKRFFTLQMQNGEEFNFEEQERGAKNNIIMRILRLVEYPALKTTKKALIKLGAEKTMQIRLNTTQGWNVQQYTRKSQKTVTITVDWNHVIITDEVDVKKSRSSKLKKIELKRIRKIWMGRCTETLNAHPDAASKPQYRFFSIAISKEEWYDFEAQHHLDQHDIIFQIIMNLTFHGLKPRAGNDATHERITKLQKHETLDITFVTDLERKMQLIRAVARIQAVWRGYQIRKLNLVELLKLKRDRIKSKELMARRETLTQEHQNSSQRKEKPKNYTYFEDVTPPRGSTSSQSGAIIKSVKVEEISTVLEAPTPPYELDQEDGIGFVALPHPQGKKRDSFLKSWSVVRIRDGDLRNTPATLRLTRGMIRDDLGPVMALDVMDHIFIGSQPTKSQGNSNGKSNGKSKGKSDASNLGKSHGKSLLFSFVDHYALHYAFEARDAQQRYDIVTTILRYAPYDALKLKTLKPKLKKLIQNPMVRIRIQIKPKISGQGRLWQNPMARDNRDGDQREQLVSDENYNEMQQGNYPPQAQQGQSTQIDNESDRFPSDNQWDRYREPQYTSNYSGILTDIPQQDDRGNEHSGNANSGNHDDSSPNTQTIKIGDIRRLEMRPHTKRTVFTGSGWKELLFIVCGPSGSSIPNLEFEVSIEREQKEMARQVLGEVAKFYGADDREMERANRVMEKMTSFKEMAIDIVPFIDSTRKKEELAYQLKRIFNGQDAGFKVVVEWKRLILLFTIVDTE